MQRGSKIREISDDGVNFIKASIIDGGWGDSVIRVCEKVPNEEYLVIDGWHRVSAIKLLTPTEYKEEFEYGLTVTCYDMMTEEEMDQIATS